MLSRKQKIDSFKADVTVFLHEEWMSRSRWMGTRISACCSDVPGISRESRNGHTNAYDVPIPLMQRLDVLVLESRYTHEPHPELRDLASDRPRVSRKRVNGRETVDHDRRDKRGEIRCGVDKEGTKERPLRRGRKEGEQGGREEEERGVDGDVVSLVFAEDLVRELRSRVSRKSEKSVGREERTKPSAMAVPTACAGEPLLLPPLLFTPIARQPPGV